MFKSLLLIGGLLMGAMVIPVQANVARVDTHQASWQAIADEIGYSRETETCINLRGCGRRERT